MRKLRWRRPGMGKRGGFRAVYFWDAGSETFSMLTLYRKNAQEDLTLRQRVILRRVVPPLRKEARAGMVSWGCRA